MPPPLQCSVCGVAKAPGEYSKKQLAKRADRRCKACVDTTVNCVREELQKILQDETSTQPNRDLAQMLLSDERGMIQESRVGGVDCGVVNVEEPSAVAAKMMRGMTSKSERTKETIEAWARAAAFEQGIGSAEAAVSSAGLAMLLDESSVPMLGALR